MEHKVSDEMEKSTRREQRARQQAQNEIMKGLKNEECSQMVQKDLVLTKEEINNLKLGSGSASVGPGPLGILARPPAPASR